MISVLLFKTIFFIIFMIYFTKSVDRDTPLHLGGHMIAVSSILQNRNKLGQIYHSCMRSFGFLSTSFAN